MEKPGAIVRRAVVADVPAVKRVLADTFESTWQPAITPDTAKRYLETDHGGVYVDQTWRAFRVAEMDGQIGGMVHWNGDFIEALHVAGIFQRRGLGRLLLDHAEAEIRKAGFRRARLETDTFNEKSQAFYRARGYVETARYPDEEWDSGLTTILFEKPLA